MRFEQAPERDPSTPLASRSEEALDALLLKAHLAAPHQMAGLVAEQAAVLGVEQAVIYLADLQQEYLVPLADPSAGRSRLPLPVDTTLAGRAFQHVEIQVQAVDQGVQVWLPMLDGTERLGVLAVTVPAELARSFAVGGPLGVRLRRFASLVAELVATKTAYGDDLVLARRRQRMSLPAEMQWSLLPPLTFGCAEVTIAGALEPAYEVAGDTLDYAVNRGRVHLAVVDGMGHGLQSAQSAVLAVSAYRNGRRGDLSLAENFRNIDATLQAAFGSEVFATAVLAELDSDTGRFTWVSAGHPEPVLMRRGRMVKLLTVEPSLPLGLGGVEPGAGPPVVGTAQLEPGDQVLLYTDGVIEARSPEGELFGVPRLVDLVSRQLAGGLPAPETMRRVVRALLAHQQGRLTDDATLLLVEWRGSSQENLLPG